MSRQPLPDAPIPRLALRRAEAAAALGVSDDYFRERIAPHIRWFRDGRVSLVAVDELARYLRENAAYALEDGT